MNEAAEALVLANLDLVQAPARSMWLRTRCAVPLDDLKQYAYMGLMRAAERYDPNRGTSFKTFAIHKIKGAMLDGMRSERGLRKKDAPTEWVPLDIDPPDKHYDFRLSVEAQLDLEHLEKLVVASPRHLRDLKVLRLVGIEGKTVRQVAREMGVSEGRICQRIKSACEMLRDLAK